MNGLVRLNFRLFSPNFTWDFLNILTESNRNQLRKKKTSWILNSCLAGVQKPGVSESGVDSYVESHQHYTAATGLRAGISVSGRAQECWG